jgi:uncharacterized protein (DUF983 family)
VRAHASSTLNRAVNRAPGLGDQNVGKQSRRIIDTVSRGARLKCPACGRASIFDAPFRRRDQCPSCAASFEREEGYFVGAISINLVATEAALLCVYFVCLLTVGFDEGLIFKVLLPVALLFPVVFYHFSWGAWLAFDHFFEPLPKFDERRRRGKGRPNAGDN